MKKLKNILNKTIDVIVFLLSFGGAVADKAIGDGIVDYSGQGRDKHGR